MSTNNKARLSLLDRASARPEPMTRSVAWAALTALGLASAYLALALVVGLMSNRVPDLVSLAWNSARLGSFLALVLFPARLWWQSRAIQERSFAWFGLCATFFGLGMLVIFFAQLSYQSWEWFQTMPRLVERRNQELITDVAQAEQNIKNVLAKIQREMANDLAQAQTEEEKKELRETYEKDVIPGQLADLEITAREKRILRDQGVRENTAPLALLGNFLTQGPSNESQDAGIYPAILGSLLLALITILFAVPVGIGAALYLEEYRHASWLGQVVQININNLAGVPSVVFGILGAYVFVELIFKPLESLHPDIAARNVLGGGLTLGLLTLPVVIVAAQEAIRAVPSSIRQGAYALGATRWQVIQHQVLPMATPGILTGTILALSRAMGEAAPLILFGALLFVNQDPTLFSRFTILPMQIFGWADRPAITVNGTTLEIWRYNAALASLVLLLALLSLNALAIFLRYRAQRHTRF